MMSTANTTRLQSIPVPLSATQYPNLFLFNIQGVLTTTTGVAEPPLISASFKNQVNHWFKLVWSLHKEKISLSLTKTKGYFHDPFTVRYYVATTKGDFIQSSPMVNSPNTPACFRDDTFLTKKKLTSECIFKNNHNQCYLFVSMNSSINESILWSVLEKIGVVAEPPIMEEVVKSLLDDVFHDVTILCEVVADHSTTVIPAASFVLMLHSPVFAIMLSTGMKESDERVIRISAHRPSIVQKMVSFMYDDKIELKSCQEALEVFAIAHEYQMDRLMAKCNEYLELHAVVNAANLLDSWAPAVKYSIAALKFKVLQYAEDHLDDLVGDGEDALQRASHIADSMGSELLLFRTKRQKVAGNREALSVMTFAMAFASAKDNSFLHDCNLVGFNAPSDPSSSYSIGVASYILKLHSPVFREMLITTKSKEISTLNYNKQTVGQMLDYMYTNKFPESLSCADVLLLFGMAFDFQVADLLLHCQRRLLQLLDSSTALDIWRLGKTFNNSELKRTVLLFVSDNLAAMLEGKIGDCADVAKEITAEIGYELLLFQVKRHPLQLEG